MSDFSIDVKEVTNQSLEKRKTFWAAFGLSNLVKAYTCYSKTHKSAIDLILTKKMSSFQLTKAAETGISDVRLLVSTHMEHTSYQSEIELVSAQSLETFQ